MPWKLLFILKCVSMALFYTRTFIRAVSTTLINNQLCPALLHSLPQMGSKDQPVVGAVQENKLL